VISLGNVGTLSGPVGSIGVGMLQATQAWVKHVNARGGLNGHPVQVIAVDDGGDPARYRAGLQDLAENKKVLAFVNNAQELTRASIKL
jgi:branched-chain amino acid transport system substrate-binding protein